MITTIIVAVLVFLFTRAYFGDKVSRVQARLDSAVSTANARANTIDRLETEGDNLRANQAAMQRRLDLKTGIVDHLTDAELERAKKRAKKAAEKAKKEAQQVSGK